MRAGKLTQDQESITLVLGQIPCILQHVNPVRGCTMALLHNLQFAHNLPAQPQLQRRPKPIPVKLHRFITSQYSCVGNSFDSVAALLQMQRQTEAENAAAEAEQLQVQEQEWNMAELERIQEQQVRVASFPGIGYRFKVNLSLCHSHNHVWQHVPIDNK